MQLLLTILSVAAWGSVAALIVAVAACAIRRWHFAARVARATALAGTVLVLTSVGATIVLPVRVSPSDPWATATLLSQGTSELMNCGALALVAALLAAGLGGLARWRLRVGRSAADKK